MNVNVRQTVLAPLADVFAVIEAKVTLDELQLLQFKLQEHKLPHVLPII